LRAKSILGLLKINGLPLYEINLRNGYIPTYEPDFSIEGMIEFLHDDLAKFDLLR